MSNSGKDNQSLQENILSTLLDTIPDLFYAKDLDMRYTHVSNAMVNFYDLTREDFIGKTNDEIWHGGEISEHFDEINHKVVDEKQMVVREEYIANSYGEVRSFNTTRMPIWVNGEISGVVGIGSDVTEYKDREKAIANSFEYAKLLSESLVRITRSPAITIGDLETVAMLIAQEGCTALNVRSAGVWRLAPSGTALRCISYYHSGTGKHSVAEDYDMESNPKYTSRLKTQRLIVVNNVNAYEYEVDDPYNVGLCAYLEAPIYAGGKLYGVISIEQNRSDDYPDGREWTLEEQSYASSLADMMALAVASFEKRVAYEKIAIAANSKEEILADVKVRAGSILIVDDDPQTIAVLTKTFENKHRVYAVTSGIDAIEVAKEIMPDIILLDVIMPDMNGYEVIIALKTSSKTSDIPIIIITGHCDADVEVKSLQLGAIDFIPKPFNLDLVKLRVENQLKIINYIRTIEADKSGETPQAEE
ncbi:MAG: response regulator [Oscillospiraceae bacterium]|nr:response regulator [Oscillospiraceae bacterium]